ANFGHSAYARQDAPATRAQKAKLSSLEASARAECFQHTQILMRYICDMKIREAANRLGVSERRARALAASGLIPARKAGTTWVVSDAAKRPGRGRPLAPAAQRQVTEALHNRSLIGLRGHDRRRTAQRLRTLRSTSDPVLLLRGWFPRGAALRHGIPVNFGYRLVALAHQGKDLEVRDLLARKTPEYLRAPEDLAEIVASERVINGLSAADLATKSETTVDVIRTLERSGAYTSPGTLRRILHTLDVSPAALPPFEMST
ncbi:MAG: hypothetical protein L0I80_09350, partial [Brevibacterium sp.]|nr:hypothetical protein [Brevibacterium sp.]